MTQDPTFFWEFQIAVQSMKALLKGTTHHLNDTELHKCIEAGMNHVLYVQAMNVKCNKITNFHEWLNKVKHVDDKKHFEHEQAVKAFEQSAASFHAATCEDNQQGLNHPSAFSGPSCGGNFPSVPPSSSSILRADYPSTLTKEKNLLMKYNGCLRC